MSFKKRAAWTFALFAVLGVLLGWLTNGVLTTAIAVPLLAVAIIYLVWHQQKGNGDRRRS